MCLATRMDMTCSVRDVAPCAVLYRNDGAVSTRGMTLGSTHVMLLHRLRIVLLWHVSLDVDDVDDDDVGSRG